MTAMNPVSMERIIEIMMRNEFKSVPDITFIQLLTAIEALYGISRNG